jgi:hypothetical protein
MLARCMLACLHVACLPRGIACLSTDLRREFIGWVEENKVPIVPAVLSAQLHPTSPPHCDTRSPTLQLMLKHTSHECLPLLTRTSRSETRTPRAESCVHSFACHVRCIACSTVCVTTKRPARLPWAAHAATPPADGLCRATGTVAPTGRRNAGCARARAARVLPSALCRARARRDSTDRRGCHPCRTASLAVAALVHGVLTRVAAGAMDLHYRLMKPVNFDPSRRVCVCAHARACVRA